MKPKKPSLDVLPCPLCLGTRLTKSGDGTVHAGHLSCSSEGVECLKCKLTLSVPHPEFFPRRMPKGLPMSKQLEWIERDCLRKAIKRWNKIPRLKLSRRTACRGTP